MAAGRAGWLGTPPLQHAREQCGGSRCGLVVPSSCKLRASSKPADKSTCRERPHSSVSRHTTAAAASTAARPGPALSPAPSTRPSAHPRSPPLPPLYLNCGPAVHASLASLQWGFVNFRRLEDAQAAYEKLQWRSIPELSQSLKVQYRPA